MSKSIDIIRITTEQLNAQKLPEHPLARVQKVTELTPKQNEMLAHWRDSWIAIGKSTDPADRPRAEAAARACYRAAGFKEPSEVLWGVDPADTTRKGMARSKELTGESPAWSSYFGGQFWVGWYYGLASCSFLIDACGLDIGAELEFRHRAYAALAQSASWAWFSPEVCALSEKPYILKTDNNRLHNPVGPSVAWKDGLELYNWRGTKVPKNWIMEKDKLPVATALTERNLELRNAAAQIIGWERVLKEFKARVIDTDKDPQIGQLLECDLPDAPKSRFLKVACGTGRTFVLAVPNSVNTALEANAATYGVTGRDALEAFKSYRVRT